MPSRAVRLAAVCIAFVLAWATYRFIEIPIRQPGIGKKNVGRNALVLFVLVRALFVEAFKIPSGSMEGTLLVGDFLLVNKVMYGAEVPLTGKRLPALRQPRRGDVIVFEWPRDRSKNFGTSYAATAHVGCPRPQFPAFR